MIRNDIIVVINKIQAEETNVPNYPKYVKPTKCGHYLHNLGIKTNTVETVMCKTKPSLRTVQGWYNGKDVSEKYSDELLEVIKTVIKEHFYIRARVRKERDYDFERIINGLDASIVKISKLNAGQIGIFNVPALNVPVSSGIVERRFCYRYDRLVGEVANAIDFSYYSLKVCNVDELMDIFAAKQVDEDSLIHLKKIRLSAYIKKRSNYTVLELFDILKQVSFTYKVKSWYERLHSKYKNVLIDAIDVVFPGYGIQYFDVYNDAVRKNTFYDYFGNGKQFLVVYRDSLEKLFRRYIDYYDVLRLRYLLISDYLYNHIILVEKNIDNINNFDILSYWVSMSFEPPNPVYFWKGEEPPFNHPSSPPSYIVLPKPVCYDDVEIVDNDNVDTFNVIVDEGFEDRDENIYDINGKLKDDSFCSDDGKYDDFSEFCKERIMISNANKEIQKKRDKYDKQLNDLKDNDEKQKKEKERIQRLKDKQVFHSDLSYDDWNDKKLEKEVMQSRSSNWQKQFHNPWAKWKHDTAVLTDEYLECGDVDIHIYDDN